jgi:hypothetical protein
MGHCHHREGDEMDINLTGHFWRWPFNVTGQATGQDPGILGPNINFNLSSLNVSELNVFNFSGQATINFTLFSIIALISIAVIMIMVIITPVIIRYTTKNTLRYSDELCNEHSDFQRLSSIYSQICGQRLLAYKYNVSYFLAIGNENNPKIFIELIEKIANSNEELLKIMGLVQLFFSYSGKEGIFREEKIEQLIRDIIALVTEFNEQTIASVRKTYWDINFDEKNKGPIFDEKDKGSMLKKYDPNEYIKKINEIDSKIQKLLRHMEKILQSIPIEIKTKKWWQFWK